MILIAVVAIQLGAAVSTQLFPVIGVEGAVAVRVIFSAVLLWMFVSKGWKILYGGFKSHWTLLLVFGICMATMNFFFYKAIDRIPLGVAVALEFSGPLTVSAVTSKKLSQLVWVALAAVGILLLTPLSGAALDGWGVLFALCSGLGWALFIPLSRRVSARLENNDGLVIGMTVAAILMIPFAVPIAPTLFANPQVLFIAFAVALLSTAVPFLLEFKALKKISATTYGVLVSTEPAVAALVGVTLLHESIGVRGLTAVACVVTAAIAITISDMRESRVVT